MILSSLELSYLCNVQYFDNYSIQSTISALGSSQYSSKVSSNEIIISLLMYLPYSSVGASMESRILRRICRSWIAARIAVSYFLDVSRSDTRVSSVTTVTGFAGFSTRPAIMFPLKRADISAIKSTLLRKVRVKVFVQACRSSLRSVSSFAPFSN